MGFGGTNTFDDQSFPNTISQHLEAFWSFPARFIFHLETIKNVIETIKKKNSRCPP